MQALTKAKASLPDLTKFKIVQKPREKTATGYFFLSWVTAFPHLLFNRNTMQPAGEVTGY